MLRRQVGPERQAMSTSPEATRSREAPSVLIIDSRAQLALTRAA